MKKVILIPDSFKGTMSSIELCKIMRDSIKKMAPEIETISIPVADGGEGTVDAFLHALGGEEVTLTVKGPHFDDVVSRYGIISNNIAIIEMASAAGLSLASHKMRPEYSTTYGVGQMILDACERGCKQIVLGLGGSSTNDGGCGAAAAAGCVFRNRFGEEFIPTGKTLIDIVHIDKSKLDLLTKQIEITVMCDVQNPLFGINGAAYVFGPQKGADMSVIKLLDDGLKHFSAVIKECVGTDVSKLSGGGAAGGMGAGMVALFGSKLKMGIEVILDVARFEVLLRGADLVITGEGRIDNQSFQGKVISGVAKRAKKANVPVIAIVGDIGDSIEKMYERGVVGVFSINRCAIPFSEARLRSKNDLSLTVENLFAFIKAMCV